MGWALDRTRRRCRAFGSEFSSLVVLGKLSADSMVSFSCFARCAVRLLLSTYDHDIEFMRKPILTRCFFLFVLLHVRLLDPFSSALICCSLPLGMLACWVDAQSNRTRRAHLSFGVLGKLSADSMVSLSCCARCLWRYVLRWLVCCAPLVWSVIMKSE